MFQSSRCIFHVVHKSAEIDSLHCVAQLQVGHTQGAHYPRNRHFNSALLLFDSRLHGEENAGRLGDCLV